MFSIRNALLLTLLLLLGACSTPFRSDVARFHTLQPVPAGATISIEAADPNKRGSLEFQTYAARVSEALASRGFRAAAPGTPADFTLLMDYGIDQGRERIATRFRVDSPADEAAGGYIRRVVRLIRDAARALEAVHDLQVIRSRHVHHHTSQSIWV